MAAPVTDTLPGPVPPVDAPFAAPAPQPWDAARDVVEVDPVIPPKTFEKPLKPAFPCPTLRAASSGHAPGAASPIPHPASSILLSIRPAPPSHPSLARPVPVTEAS
ncbi:hypothetical protein K490DRAFT_68999 [Saccharata proteae CBS 121410]|uniref:Uncharacterized protein n=1 Tax=Saccharata proteae CBS 121410 TaxID=1314787 RepID=A0A9P4HRE4_9PEZI|nr:hypothetical protein K490DRAFT_68999 [Saccharata proteae CBS 121410]